jgi:hypothetical protein
MDKCWQNLPSELTYLIIEWKFIISIRTSLNQYGYGFLLDIVEKHNSCIAGSFILQCILGEFYEKSDIDIFTSLSTEETRGKSLCYVQPIEGKIYDILSMPEKNNYIVTNSGSLPENNLVVYTRKFPSENDVSINTVIIKHISPKKFIKNHFDGDLCSLYFDGKSLKYQSSVISLRSDIIKKIWNKRIHFNLFWNNEQAQSIEEIYNSISYGRNNLEFYFLNSCHRMSKYKKRGYSVYYVINKPPDLVIPLISQ